MQPKNRGPATNNRLLSVKYLDEETGLSSYTYRYYHPDRGRWVNRDPIGERGGVNLYRFVGNKATYAVDPIGLSHVLLPRLGIEFPPPVEPRPEPFDDWFPSPFLKADGTNTVDMYLAGRRDCSTMS